MKMYLLFCAIACLSGAAAVGADKHHLPEEVGARYKVLKPIITATDKKYAEDLANVLKAKDKEGGLEMVATRKARTVDDGILLILAVHNQSLLGDGEFVECRHIIKGKSRGKVFVFAQFFTTDFMAVESLPKITLPE